LIGNISERKGRSALKKLLHLLLALILISGGVLSSCSQIRSSTTSSPTSSGNGVLTFNNTAPYTLDPAASNDALSASYIVQIFSGLLKLNDNLEPVPDIAANMPTISADGLTYTFQLRKDVKFSDGTPVTADDFQYSWERVANPATNSPTAAAYLGDIVGVSDMLAGKATRISGVKIIDNYTLQLTIKSPESYFLYKLTVPTFFVVEQSNVSSGVNWWQKPIGTGPFKVQEWKKDTDFILARNDLYYADKAKIAQVKMILNSTSSDMDLFETGQVDIAGPSTAYYDKIMDKAEPFYSDLSISINLSVDYIGFNCKQPPFDDANIRKAFSLAIDKDIMVSLTYRNMAQKAEGILPPDLPGYNKNLVGLDYDVNQAQALIKASKYGDVSKLPPITLTIEGAGGTADPITQALVYQWKQNLGIDVKVRELEPEVYNSSNLSQELDQMYYFGWIADYPYPQDFLEILFNSKSSFNYGGYSSQAVDTLIQQANQTLDQNNAFSQYQQAEQQIVNDAAILPLTFGETYLLVQAYVKNLRINALGFINFNEITISPH
jgi:oligopeptide transport system substrate-binding protein